MIVLCAAAFVLAMVFSPPEEIVFLYYYRSDPNVLCLLGEDTIVLQCVDSENKLRVGLSQLTSLIAIPAVFSVDLQGTPLRLPFTVLSGRVQ